MLTQSLQDWSSQGIKGLSGNQCSTQHWCEPILVFGIFTLDITRWSVPTYRILGPLRMMHPLCTKDQLNFAQQALTKTQKTQVQMFISFYVFCIPASFPCKLYHEYVEIPELNTSHWSTESCPAKCTFLTPSQVTGGAIPYQGWSWKGLHFFCRVGWLAVFLCPSEMRICGLGLCIQILQIRLLYTFVL